MLVMINAWLLGWMSWLIVHTGVGDSREPYFSHKMLHREVKKMIILSLI